MLFFFLLKLSIDYEINIEKNTWTYSLFAQAKNHCSNKILTLLPLWDEPQ